MHIRLWWLLPTPPARKTGERTRTWSSCGAVDTDSIEKLSHTVSDWTVTKEPTCQEEGKETGTCSVCGEKVTRAIPTGGHQVESWETVKEATCTQEGKETGACTVCNQKQSRVIPKLPHTVEWIPKTLATETAEGSGHVHCTVCGYEGPEERVAPHVALPGSQKNWIQEDKTPLRLRISGHADRFQSIQVDEQEVSSEYYILPEGSSVIELNAQFLSTLTPGTHRVDVTYSDGTGGTSFDVLEPEPVVPETTASAESEKIDYSIPEPDHKLELAAHIGVGILAAAAVAGIVYFIITMRRNFR